MKTVFITGVAGFIGSHLCDQLLEKGYSIIGIDSFNDFYDPAIKEKNLTNAHSHSNFQLYTGSILDTNLLKEIFQTYSIDSIVHLAAYAGVRPSIENPHLYFDTNITGTNNILDCAKEFNIKRVLAASSSSVYGNNKKVPFAESDPVDQPISPYAATKKCNEVLAYNYHHLNKTEIACLRFFTVYGPRQRPEMAIHKFSRMIMEGKPIPVFNEGNCLRDYTFVDDIIHGVIQILESPSLSFDIVNLGESKTISTLDLITLIEEELGKKATLNLMPAQEGDVEQTFADITHAKNRYNYNPQFPIEKGIKEFVKWFKSENK